MNATRRPSLPGDAEVEQTVRQFAGRLFLGMHRVAGKDNLMREFHPITAKNGRLHCPALELRHRIAAYKLPKQL